MRTIKVLAIIGLAVALVAVPALAQKAIEVKVTCDAANNKIDVKPDPVRISFAAKETVKWVISGTTQNSVGACKVKDGKLDKDGQAMQDLGLNKIEIEIVDRTLLQLAPAKAKDLPHIGSADWKRGADTEITGTPQKVGSSKYTIRFIKAGSEVLLLEQGDKEVASVEATPTLTEWGLIALAVLLAGGMGYMIYRRRPALRPAAP